MTHEEIVNRWWLVKSTQVYSSLFKRKKDKYVWVRVVAFTAYENDINNVRYWLGDLSGEGVTKSFFEDRISGTFNETE